MNKLTGLFFGVFLLFGLSWLALAAYPYITFAGLQQSKDEATGALAPPGNPGTADQGARVYAANGCFYCHSQYVRDKNEGSDIDRGRLIRSGSTGSCTILEPRLLSRSCRRIDGCLEPRRSRVNHPPMPSSWKGQMHRLPVMKWSRQRKEKRLWTICSH